MNSETEMELIKQHRGGLGEATSAFEHLLAEHARLRMLLRPFAEFAKMWEEKPLGGMDDVIYGIHLGTQWEAKIRLSDMKRAAEFLGE